MVILVITMTGFESVVPSWADSAAECAAQVAEAETWDACKCHHRRARRTDATAAERSDATDALVALDAAGDACGSYFLAHLRRSAGDDGAGELFRRAADRATRDGQPLLAIRARHFLGEHLKKKEQALLALAQFEIAREGARQHDERRVEALALQSALNIRTLLGQDLTAVEAETLDVIERLDRYPIDQANLLSVVGNARFRLGRYAAAADMFEHAQRLFLAADKPDLALRDEYNRALQWLTTEHADRERARAALEMARQRAVRLGVLKVEARALHHLGALVGGDEGEALVRHSVQIAGPLPTKERLEGWRELATLLAGRHPADARRALDTALAERRELDFSSTDAFLWEARMRVAWATRDPATAVAESLAVLDDLEALVDRQYASGGRGELFAVWTEAYDWLAGRLFALATGDSRFTDLRRLDGTGALSEGPWHDLDAAALGNAFDVLERRRARLLLASMHEKRAVMPAEHREVLDAMVEVNLELLSEDLPAARRDRLTRRLDVLELREAEILRRTEAASPPPRRALDFVDLDTARATLGPDEALLVYQLAPWRDVYRRFAGGSWLLVLHRTGSSLHALGDPGPLTSGLDLFVGMLPSRDGLDAVPARTLGRRLLGRALDTLPAEIDHLLLIPDGALHRLPFEALGLDDGSPVGLRYRLSRLPSATVWNRWRSAETATSTRSALVFADPRPAGTDTTRTASSRSWSPRGETLGRLPGAAAEGRAIRERLGRSTTLRLDDEASEAALRTLDPGRFAIVHFAAHAVVDGQRGRRSGVVLAAGGPRDDGLLQPPEIAALDLDGRLVVLSACHSAAGRVLRGEGPLSLARAFHQAGSPAVVAGLWRLQDDDTRLFFERFYAALAEGDDVASAARVARRQAIEAGAPTDAWAGVTVLGDGAHRPFEDGRIPPALDGPTRTLAIAIAILALAGLAIGIRRFRTGRRSGYPPTRRALDGFVASPMQDAATSPTTRDLEAQLGHRFGDPSLASLALTHSSASNERGREDNYERLEFLGDAVLGLLASEWLYHRYADKPEGQLAKLKSFLVSTPVLADFARSLDLGRRLQLGVGEERSGGRDKPSILADAVEALLGAIYLDGGLPPARALVGRILERGLAQRGRIHPADAKTRLQELTQGAGLGLPSYRLIGEEGPDHAKRFTVECSFDDRCVARAEGRSKKAAEQSAAAAALDVLADDLDG